MQTLREEIDLDQPDEHLLGIIHETLLPGSALLWQRVTIRDDDKNIFLLLQWRQQHTTSSSEDSLDTPGRVLVHLDDLAINTLLESSDVVKIKQLYPHSPLSRALQQAGDEIALPLINRGELLGLLSLGPRLSGEAYMLLNVLSAQTLPVAQMVREEQVRERERIEQELRIAQII